jgi:hypothetical protein
VGRLTPAAGDRGGHDFSGLSSFSDFRGVSAFRGFYDISGISVAIVVDRQHQQRSL